MFEQLAAEQSAFCEDECPGLLDDQLGNSSPLPQGTEQSRMNVDGIADFEGTNAMLLWDSLEAVAHDDDGEVSTGIYLSTCVIVNTHTLFHFPVHGVAQLDVLQHWISQKSSANNYNLRALLRVSNLAGK